MRYLQSTPPFPALPYARERGVKPPPAPLLAAAVHAQSEGVLIAARRWTRQGLNVIFANESFCAMTGYTQPELQQKGEAFLHENRKDNMALHRWQRRVAAGGILSGEAYLIRKDSARVYSSWNYCTVSDERGHVTHIVATYRDLTEKRKLQEALIHSQRLDAVGRLAGGVAHDFNNLLSVINGYCEMMATQPSIRHAAAHELEEIHRATQKAAHLVRQLLAFSRRQVQNPRVVNLDHMVCDNAEILKRLLNPAYVLELALAAGPANIRVDPAQIQQVLLNLTLNARDALRTGGRVSISTGTCDIGPCTRSPTGAEITPGRYAILSVSDNGHGMDEQTRAHLFEPFFTTKDPGKGTGLGLALVYGVVQQSNGFIRVHSARDMGSSFEVFLPVVDAPAQPVSTPLPSLPSTKGREHVVVLEEDEVVRKMLAGILTADGYSVTSSHARAALVVELREAARPVDLVVAQLGAKPGSEGEKLVRALHRRNPSLRVIGTGNPECAPLKFIAPTRQATLAKPFALSTLMRTVRDLLDAQTTPES